jgi:hypothetical protein
MIAIAKAPGNRTPTWSNDGATGDGSPDGTWAIRARPWASIEVTATSTIPPITATSGPGARGASRRGPSSTAIVAAENTIVVQLTEPRSNTARISLKKLSALGLPGIPNSLGSCPAATVRPTPTLIPVSVASEMLSITTPTRRSRATSRIAPTSSVRVANARAGSWEPAAT